MSGWARRTGTSPIREHRILVGGSLEATRWSSLDHGRSEGGERHKVVRINAACVRWARALSG